MSGIMESADITNVGRGGYGGLGGGFGGGGGIWDIIALGLVTNGGLLGNNKKDDCCPPPATCKDVWDVDKDVLSTANQTQNELREMANNITNSITTGNYATNEKITNGFFALNDKVTGLAYAQQSLAKDTINAITVGNAEIKGLIISTALETENKNKSAVICAQNEEINRYKIIEALKCCDK